MDNQWYQSLLPRGYFEYGVRQFDNGIIGVQVWRDVPERQDVVVFAPTNRQDLYPSYVRGAFEAAHKRLFLPAEAKTLQILTENCPATYKVERALQFDYPFHIAILGRWTFNPQYGNVNRRVKVVVSLDDMDNYPHLVAAAYHLIHGQYN